MTWISVLDSISPQEMFCLTTPYGIVEGIGAQARMVGRMWATHLGTTCSYKLQKTRVRMERDMKNLVRDIPSIQPVFCVRFALGLANQTEPL